MCCLNEMPARKELLKSFGKRKTRVCWKLVNSISGKSWPSGYKYSPGRHKAHVKRYYKRLPKGIHVYTTYPEYIILREEVVIPVICNRNNLLRAERRRINSQAVFTEILILKKDWEEAMKGKC